MPAMEFDIKGQDGTEATVDEQHVLGQLQQAGYNPKGVSADGTMLTLTDSKGEYQVPVHEALGNLGWQVTGQKPMDADYSNVQHGWRAGVHNLPDDDMRHAYIAGKMKQAGVPDAKIVGSGRDWYVFNPTTNQWIGVTNNPEWDSSDLVEGALEVPRFIGSTLGGAAGAGLGAGTPLSIAGAAGGAALGGGAVDALTRTVQAGLDPEYAKVAAGSSDAMHKTIADVGYKAALDGATAGFFKGAPMVAGAFKPGAEEVTSKLLNNGLASSAIRGTGKTMQGVGNAAGFVGKKLDNDVGRSIVTGFVPGLNGAEAAGFGMQLPAQAVRGATKAVGWVGEKAGSAADGFAESELGQHLAKHAPEAMEDVVDAAHGLGAKATNFSRALVKGGAKEAKGGGERFGQYVSGAEEGIPMYTNSPSNVLKNAGRMAGEATGGPSVQKKALIQTYKEARKMGFDPSVSHGAGREAATEVAAAGRAIGQQTGKWGHAVGRGMEGLETAGKAVQNLATLPAAAGIKAARYGGAAASKVGGAMNQAGAALAPLENRALFRYGAEEALPVNHLGQQVPEWMDDQNDAKLKAILAARSSQN